jgi:hypothetical protein
MWERFYLEGAAYRYRLIQNAGKPDWDLASIAAPHAALLFALDLAYREQLEARRRERIRFEESFDLDPARSDIAGGVIRSGVLRCDEGAPVRYAIIGTAADPKGSYAINEWVYDSDDTGGGRKLEDYWRSTGHKGLSNVPVMGDAVTRPMIPPYPVPPQWLPHTDSGDRSRKFIFSGLTPEVPRSPRSPDPPSPRKSSTYDN